MYQVLLQYYHIVHVKIHTVQPLMISIIMITIHTRVQVNDKVAGTCHVKVIQPYRSH